MPSVKDESDMERQPEGNWWDRNWKWAVPVGCLGALLLVAAFVAAILGLVFGMMKSSEVYREAVGIAEANPVVQRVLGAPVEEGLFVTGSINVSGSSGSADMAIPISGPRGAATVYVVGEKVAGRWTYVTLVVKIEETGQRVDLLE